MLRYLATLVVALVSALSLCANAVAASTDDGLLWDLSSRPVLALQLPGMSHHFQEPKAPGRRYNENHAGIGVEWRSLPAPSGWLTKASVGLMEDSLFAWGAYAGYVWQKRLVDTQNWSLDAGGGVFLFYRTFDFEGEHRLVPGPLPVVSVEHKGTGIGMNILFVPHVKLGSREMPAVLYAQFTKTF